MHKALCKQGCKQLKVLKVLLFMCKSSLIHIMHSGKYHLHENKVFERLNHNDIPTRFGRLFALSLWFTEVVVVVYRSTRMHLQYVKS